MPVAISLLRAVNVGGHAVVKMADLKALYESLKLTDVQTYVQSGNVVFRTEEKDLSKLSARIQAAITKKCGVTPGVILRMTNEMQAIVARNPFAKRHDIEPAKLHVFFLNAELCKTSSEQLRALPVREEIVPSGRELFIYFPDGAGKSKLPGAKLDKICGTRGTARNWNTVTKLLEIAERLESE
ncbi:MAG: DUF1697 domain-containing protein [Candidatus Acidiferrum sp.]